MGLLKRIHVNQHNIRANAKNGNENLPIYTIKTYNENYKAHHLEIKGPSKMVYRPNNPLSCGAKCWIETRAEVVARNAHEIYVIAGEEFVDGN